jgi:hemolysin III
MEPAGVRWLLLGGVCYSAGVAFYARTGRPFAHFVWHVFVLAGSTCHFFGALWYAA